MRDAQKWDSVRRKTAFQIWVCENCGSTVACSLASNREHFLIGIAPDVSWEEATENPKTAWNCINQLMTDLCCDHPRYTSMTSANIIVELKNTPVIQLKKPRIDFILDN